MLKEHFNIDASQMTFKEFKEAFTGNPVLIKYKIDIKAAFKELGGKMTKKKVKKRGGRIVLFF